MTGPQESTPLIIDTDGGLDDALALMMLIAHRRRPSLITTSFGNVSLEQATDNILDTLAVLDHDCAVYAGAAGPLAGELIDATNIHGQDGLGGAPRPATISKVRSGNAVAMLCETLLAAAARQEPVDVLTLGPLTNLALAVSLEPTLIAGVRRLYIMGGTCFGRGNVTPAAEFNIHADPEAAAIVLGRMPVATLIPWEPSLDNPVPGARVDDILAKTKPGPARDFITALCDQGRAVHRRYHDEDALVLPDPLAAAVLLEPSMVLRTRTCPVLVECAGQYTRGATIPVSNRETVLDRPDVTVVEKIDAERLEALFKETVLQTGNR